MWIRLVIINYGYAPWVMVHPSGILLAKKITIAVFSIFSSEIVKKNYFITYEYSAYHQIVTHQIVTFGIFWEIFKNCQLKSFLSTSFLKCYRKYLVVSTVYGTLIFVLIKLLRNYVIRRPISWPFVSDFFGPYIIIYQF